MCVDISGKVEIKNGDKKVVVGNHIVNNGIVSLMWYMIGGYYWAQCGTYNREWHAELGEDTSTNTTPSDNGLVSVISGSPDVKSGNLNSGSDFYEVVYHFTWNSGSVTGTLGECGLWITCQENTGFESGDNDDELMFSRLSSADGDFSSFVIDDTKPLTIDWTIRFEFV